MHMKSPVPSKTKLNQSSPSIDAWGSSSSNSAAEDMADNSDISYPVKDVIDVLREAMEAGFDGLRSELDRLKYELKNDIDQIIIETQGLKQSLEFTQGDVAIMKEKAEMDL